jgi:hypothetical protein
MHHNDHQPPARLQDSTDAAEHRRQWMNVLNRQHAGSRVELSVSKVGKVHSIRDFVMNLRRPALTGGPNQFNRRIRASDTNPTPMQRPTKHALPARDIDHRITLRSSQQPQNAWDNDLLVILAAGISDEFVIPLSNGTPIRANGTLAIGFAGRLARSLLHFFRPGISAERKTIRSLDPLFGGSPHPLEQQDPNLLRLLASVSHACRKRKPQQIKTAKKTRIF